jgi:hypothetical protein
MEQAEQMLCRLCGERIGIYERIVVLTPGGDRHSSRAREPDLTWNDFLMHEGCYMEWNEPAPPGRSG